MKAGIRMPAMGLMLVGCLFAGGMMTICRAADPGSSPGAGPASQPTSLPDKFITTTGRIAPIGVQPDGIVQLQTSGGPRGDVRKIATNDKTVVVLLNGKTGKPSDLRPSQFVTVYQAADGGPALRIEPALTPEAERRLAVLDGQLKSVTVEVNCSLKTDPRAFMLSFSVVEQHRADLGRFVVLREAEMAAVLRYFAREGFLANAHDFALFAVLPQQPRQSCMWTIRSEPPKADPPVAAMHFIQHRPWDKDCIERLDGLRSVLPAGAIKDLDWLVKKMRDQMPTPEVTP